MNEAFELPVQYKGVEQLFPAQLLQFGYTHKFQVDVYGTIIFFEPDEERSYRAIVEANQVNNISKIDAELIKAIAGAIEAVLK